LPGVDSSPWTAPASGSGSVFVWGTGENGTTNTRGGDGAYCCGSDQTFVASQTYPWSIGAVGSGSGAAGGDGNWNSGEIVAPGGGSATSPVGTTQNAGGTAPSGTGTQSGGGSGGTSTAASGTAPGEPNGAGGSSQVTSLRPGGGGR